MNVEPKSNKNIFPTSIYTFSAEELNQITAELQHIISEGGITANASDTTQVLAALRVIFEYMDSTKVNDNNGVNTKSQYQRNRDFEAAIAGGLVSLTGVYIPYGGDILPAGWLWCDGSALSRTDYAELFAKIGTKFGTGDGSTTFNIPDFTGGRFIEGDSSSGTYKDAGLPNHYHVFGSNGFHSNAGGFVSTNFAAITGQVDNTLSSYGYVGWNGSGNDSAEFHGNSSSFSGCMITTLAKQSTTTQKDGINGNATGLQPKSLTSRWIIRY